MPFHGAGALPGAAKAAFEKYGVTDYVVDCDFELDKLLAETGIRRSCASSCGIATPLGGAVLELSSKFGTTPDDAARLLKRVAKAGAAPCITFHVGSQCLSPFSYAQAIEMARRTVATGGRRDRRARHRRRLSRAVSRQRRAALSLVFRHHPRSAQHAGATDLPLLCEPGRALVAEGISVVTQVILRRGDRLYINDGIYGSFDEITFPA